MFTRKLCLTQCYQEPSDEDMPGCSRMLGKVLTRNPRLEMINLRNALFVRDLSLSGLTASLTHLLSNIYTQYKYIFINCMVLKSSIAIYREVAKQLNPKKEVKTEREALKVIEASIRTSSSMILLVLDEVDQLESKDQSVLYTVFEWPALDGSRLVLCGIANSLDLTDR